MIAQKASMALTEQQRQAVESTAKRIVVMAAAGSGKTRVMVERAVHLIQERGVSACDILLVTFTRKAAREIRERIKERLGDQSEIWCDTFHAIGLRLLSEGKEPLSVITPDESQALFKQVCRDISLKGVRASKAKKGLSEYTQTGAPPVERLTKMALEEFNSRLDRMHAVDYGGVLPRAIDSGRARFRHVLVDEAQDCDLIQWKFVRWLNATLFVVGDPNQTIFEWRGSDRRFMLDLAVDSEVVRMSETFRCAKPIADAATRLIEHNADGSYSCIRVSAVQGTVETCKAHLGRDEDGDADDPWVAFQQSSNESTAFLCRTNYEADEVASLLSSLGATVHRAGRTSKVSSEQGFRCAWAILSLAWNPRNDVAFNTLQEAGKIDVGPEIMSIIRQNAARTGKPLWASYLAVVSDKTALRYMIESKLRAMKCYEAGYVIKMLSQEASDLLVGTVYADDCTNKLLSAMESIDDLEPDAPDESVYVGTIHGAKGLEFDNVCVVNCDDGRFPREAEKDIESERRLMYVAMTRARHSLVLHYQNEPSRFIREALPDAIFA